jgi:hypothetical protein
MFTGKVMYLNTFSGVSINMKFNIIVLFIVLINFLQNEIFAQPQLWEIYSISDQPYINVTIDKYESDSLYIKSTDHLFVLHQDSIKYLLREKESNFGLGFLIGAVGGGIFGAAISSSSNEFYDMGFSDTGKSLSIVSGAIIGGVLGGIVGLASGADEKYQLEKLTTEHKRALLSRLFK